MANQQLSTNTFGTARWIVSPTASDGTHTTIAGALTSASSGDTIFIRPGTYTENPTLKAGVNLTAYTCDAFTPNVIINGKCTFTAAGSVSISGIELQTNSDFALAVTGSAASIVNLINCFINASNNTAISHSSSSSSSSITIQHCNGNLATTGIGLYTSTSAGGISIYQSVITNGGSSTTASSVSTATITIDNSVLGIPLSTSSSGAVNMSNCRVNSGNATCLTTAGTGTSTLINCYLASGTASTLSAGSGTTILCTNCDIASSNTNAITGAGTIQYGGLVYSSTSSTINTTTQTIKIASSFQKIVRQIFTSTGTYTPTTGMKYCDIEVVGGGGGGGGAGATTTTGTAGGGGGGGGYARGAFSAATIGTSQSVTIGAAGSAGSGAGDGGAGGTTSVGALISATGGGGGLHIGVQTTANVAAGGAGGAGSGGDFQTTGSPGGAGMWVGNATFPSAMSGAGGSSFFGGGAVGTANLNGGAAAGTAAASYGGGGSGAANTNAAAASNGGAGAKGVVVVTEYL